MTVTNEEYLHELLNGLEGKQQFKHFTSVLSPDEIKRRLRKRGDKRTDWTFNQIDRSVSAFKSSTFNEKIFPDSFSIERVAEIIAETSGITLCPDTQSSFQKKIYR